jgi:hypothetical protein
VFPLLAVGIDHTNQVDAGHFRKNARMVAAHDANADYAQSQRTTPTNPARLTHDPKGSFDFAARSPSPSMTQADWRPYPRKSGNTFCFQCLRA